MQAVAHVGNVAGRLEFKSIDPRAVEGAFVDCDGVRHAQDPRPLSVARADIEVRPLSVIAHQKRPAIFQSAVEMDDWNALAVRFSDDAIACLKNESARVHHDAIVREWR